MAASIVPSASQRSRMQATFDASMPDTCHIVTRTPGPVDDYGNPTVTWTEGTTDVACGLDMRNSYEVLASTQVLVYDARLRLPIATVITNLDRIKITKRYGATLATALLYEVIGPPRQGPSGIVVDLRTATST